MGFATVGNGSALTAGFRHEALVYRTTAECVAGVRAFLDQSDLAGGAGEAALVVAPDSTLRALAPHLVQLDVGAGVHVEEATSLAHNPARLIPTVRSFLDGHDDGSGARVVLEPVWPGRTGPELDEVIWHEALANVAFAGRKVSILCPYAAAALGGGMAAQVARDAPGDHRRLGHAGQRAIRRALDRYRSRRVAAAPGAPRDGEHRVASRGAGPGAPVCAPAGHHRGPRSAIAWWNWSWPSTRSSPTA